MNRLVMGNQGRPAVNPSKIIPGHEARRVGEKDRVEEFNAVLLAGPNHIEK